MERKKYLFVTLYCCWCMLVSGQVSNVIYQAYTSGNMASWKTAMDAFKATTNNQKLELVNYQYGYIAYCINHKAEAEAEKYLLAAESLLDEMEKQHFCLSMIYAYRSALIGFKIGLSPYKAPFIGKKSLAYARKSVAADAANYFGYVQLGNIAYYTPAMMGGSKSEAIRHFLRALELIETNGADTRGNWNYLNLLVILINSYYEQGQYEQAKKYCIKTLNAEPRFEWVKNELYPKILKKTAR